MRRERLELVRSRSPRSSARRIAEPARTTSCARERDSAAQRTRRSRARSAGWSRPSSTTKARPPSGCAGRGLGSRGDRGVAAATPPAWIARARGDPHPRRGAGAHRRAATPSAIDADPARLDAGRGAARRSSSGCAASTDRASADVLGVALEALRAERADLDLGRRGARRARGQGRRGARRGTARRRSSSRSARERWAQGAGDAGRAASSPTSRCPRRGSRSSSTRRPREGSPLVARRRAGRVRRARRRRGDVRVLAQPRRGAAAAATGGVGRRAVARLPRAPAGRSRPQARRGPTLVFDEVDAGIGGVEAVVLGRKLRDLARGGQILARHPPAAGGEPRRPSLQGRARRCAAAARSSRVRAAGRPRARRRDRAHARRRGGRRPRARDHASELRGESGVPSHRARSAGRLESPRALELGRRPGAAASPLLAPRRRPRHPHRVELRAGRRPRRRRGVEAIFRLKGRARRPGAARSSLADLEQAFALGVDRGAAGSRRSRRCGPRRSRSWCRSRDRSPPAPATRRSRSGFPATRACARCSRAPGH